MRRRTTVTADEGAVQVTTGRRARRFDDRGASAVEFALIAPLLLMLVFGIIEFGWLFAQHLDVRHGAREASRLVAVNWSETDPPATGSDQQAEIIGETCSRMQYADGSTVTMQLVASDAGAAQKGRLAHVVVSAEPVQLTGLFAPIIDPIDLDSSVDVRLEREATWTQGSGTCP